jgi:lysophospholipase L1-like esterase
MNDEETRRKYLALGDSYTIGEGVSENERWPNQLAALLEIEKPQIIATTGWRTDNLINAMTIAKLSGEYDLVSLLIGVNNQYQEKLFEQYSLDFEKLLRNCIQLAKEETRNVIAVSIPDYGFTPFGLKNKDKISKEINQYNDVAEKICASLNVCYINITDICREGLDDSTLIAPDGLHPSGKMYARWAKRISEVIR